MNVEPADTESPVCLKDVLQMPERLRQIKVKNKEAIG
jgi:hypothetical protein